MNGRRWIAWAMIVVQCGLFALFSNAMAFPIFIIALGSFGLWKGKTYPTLAKPNALTFAVLTGFYIVLWQVFPHPGTFTTMLPAGLSFPLIQIALTMQVVYFFEAKGKGSGILFPLYGVIVLTYTGDMMISVWQDAVSHVAALCFAALTAIYYALSESVPHAPRCVPNETDRLVRTHSIRRTHLLLGHFANIVCPSEPTRYSFLKPNGRHPTS